MFIELLKTAFQQHQVGFRSIGFSSSVTNSTLTILKQSQIDCSILSCGRELFIALNPATHKFNLSRLNEIIGKKLFKIEKKKNVT